MSRGTDSGSSPPQTRGIVVTHGSMCFGMVDAVLRIAGAPGDVLTAVSNDNQGPEQLVEAVKEVAGDGPAIIFTDLQTGSCALAAQFACKDPGQKRVVFGANLPMLIDFVFQRHRPIDELVTRLIESGRKAIQSFDPEVEAHGNPPLPR